MIDIREGDYLVVGSDEYPIKAVELWSQSNFNTASFQRMASVSASTKRAVVVDGISGAPTTNLTGLLITPLDPASRDVVLRMALESAVRLMETFLADSSGYLHVVVEDLQND